jgi:hypothetical protein
MEGIMKGVANSMPRGRVMEFSEVKVMATVMSGKLRGARPSPITLTFNLKETTRLSSCEPRDFASQCSHSKRKRS